MVEQTGHVLLLGGNAKGQLCLTLFPKPFNAMHLASCKVSIAISCSLNAREMVSAVASKLKNVMIYPKLLIVRSDSVNFSLTLSQHPLFGGCG